jgi:hypothetical protein
VGSTLRHKREDAISWEAISAAYEDSLLNDLRGFRSALAGLDTWVPENDVVDSIVALAEAARDGARQSVAIHLGQGTLQSLDVARLQQQAATLGQVELSMVEDGAMLAVTFSTGDSAEPRAAIPVLRRSLATPANDEAARPQCASVAAYGEHGTLLLPAGYRRRLLELTADIPLSHRGDLEAADGETAVEAACGEAVLRASIEPGRHLLRQMRWEAASDEAGRLLEWLCRLLSGLPVYEAAEHGVQRLELQLRPAGEAPPVPGILLAERLAAAFDDINRMLRELYAAYRAQSGHVPSPNYYAPPLEPAWKQLAADERASAVASCLARHPDAASMRVVRLDGAHRVVLGFSDDFPADLKQQRLMQIEALLQQHLEPHLEVYAEPRVDANKLRLQKGVRL